MKGRNSFHQYGTIETPAPGHVFPRLLSFLSFSLISFSSSLHYSLLLDSTPLLTAYGNGLNCSMVYPSAFSCNRES